MSEENEEKKPVPAAPKAKAKKNEAQDTLWSRRDFFSLTGWASFTAALGLSSLYFLRLLFPRVLFEPSPKFKAGNPEDYTVGEVAVNGYPISGCGLFVNRNNSMRFWHVVRISVAPHFG